MSTVTERERTDLAAWAERVHGVKVAEGYPGAALVAEIAVLRDFVRWEAERGNPVADQLLEILPTQLA